MTDTPVIVEQTYDAEIGKVWKAITDKDEMKHWYFDLKEFRAEVGFEFEFYGGTEHKQYLHKCKILEVVPLKKLRHSWRYEGYAGNSTVTFELFAEGEKTRVKLTHEGIESFPKTEPDIAKENFVQGWAAILGSSLKDFLEEKK
jgi:uncharacterized protein YndB with AHSA1/START domain